MLSMTPSPGKPTALRGPAMLVVLWSMLLISSVTVAQPLPAGDKAAMILNSAKLACNEKNYPLAAERFRAFLKDFPNDSRASAARYGLALVLVEGSEKNYKAAVELLAPAIKRLDSSDRPYGHYYLGLSYRGLGNTEAARSGGKAEDGAKLPAAAVTPYQQAAAEFAAAAAAFNAMVKTPPAPDARQLQPELEWAACARCDQAEMLMRLERPKEVVAALAPWLKEPGSAQSRYRNQALYLHGYACFVLKDYVAAGRSLSALAPFADPAIGVHARYLLARTHHLAEERPEAAANYEAVISGYARDRKTAEETLKNADALKSDPDRKAALEAILRNPPPDYVARALFYWGVLLYEQGRFADSLARFTLFLQQNPKSPLLAEAQLRQGMAQVQLKAFGEAARILQPLADHPQLSDQALLWLARAQIGATDPNNDGAYRQALQTAIPTLSRAAERAQSVAQDSDAKARRGDILMELADTMQLARQYKEAAAVCQKVINEYPSSDLMELAMQRQVVALQLAGQYRESDEVSQRFARTYPKSTLLPEVLFRHAENAFLQAVNAPAGSISQDELKRLYGEAIRRYQQVIEKTADTPYANLARQSMGTAHYQLGQYTEAVKVLKLIPEGERSGELAIVSYLLADCLLRTLPAEADDALATARLIEQINEVTYALTAFIGAQENGPQAPDAMLKLGFCHQRIAMLMADPVEQRKSLAKARLVYATFIPKYPKHPLYPLGLFENAKCLAQLGDLSTAVAELNRFQSDPLKNASIAPLALIRLADYMRLQKKPAESQSLLNRVKAQYEEAMLKDPARAHWVALLQYNLGLALNDSGKPAEARAVFDSLIRQFPTRREAAEAVWRSGQARRNEAMARVDAARKAVVAAARKPDELNAAKARLAESLAGVRDAAEYFQTQATALSDKPHALDVCPRMLYEAAWCNRILADEEIAAAREKLQAEAVAKLRERLSKDPSPGPNRGAVHPPEIRLAAIPIQPSEQKARANYQAIITMAEESPLANDARFELADLMSRREEFDPAIRLLSEALEMEPPRDLLDRMRLRLGACYLAKNDARNALTQFTAIQHNPRSPLLPHAQYGVAECLILQQNWAGSIQQLTPFRDNEALRNVPGTSDRALLRLGQAQAQAKQWDGSRQALEAMIQRFPNSPSLAEARYGIGYAWQMLKQYDNAIAAYTDVVNRTGAEIGAKAQLQIGLCRLEQNRPQEALNALLAVPYTYDYPELSASAFCEAARAHVELKQPAEAAKLLQRVLKENPNGPWVELAQKRLAELK